MEQATPLHTIKFISPKFWLLCIKCSFVCMSIFLAAILSSPTKPLASSMTVRMKKELKSSSCLVERRVTEKRRRERQKRWKRMNSWKLNREESMPSYQCSFSHSTLYCQQNSKLGYICIRQILCIMHGGYFHV